MTTTKANGIIPDLRSRALIFQYNRVADKDMKALLSAVIRLKGWKNLNAAVAQMLVKKAKGIPRELLKAASFCLHLSHWQHGFPLTGLRQVKAIAAIWAEEVFPVPRIPHSITKLGNVPAWIE